MTNQAKLRSFYTTPKYNYGFEIPRDYTTAKLIDTKNGHTKWSDYIILDIEELEEYDVFIDKSKNAPEPSGYMKIRMHLVFDIKHNSRQKAWCVVDGHLNNISVDSVYSGGVSLWGIRIMLFLYEINNLEIWATDIGNVYLEKCTSEKVYVITGPEIGEKLGSTLIVYKALYGLTSSGARWHDKFADDLRDIG